MKKLDYKAIGIFVFLILIFFFLIYFNSFSHVRSSITDKLYGDKEILDSIVIIKIDDESINKIGRWPWNRDIYPLILEKVKDAKFIGMDLSFFEESFNDDNLRDKLNSMDNVVLAAEVNEGVLYKPIFEADYGYVNVVTGSDGVTREVNPKLKENVLPFAFEIYKKGWNNEAEFLKKNYIINFASNPNSFSSINVNGLLDGNESFKNKFVLIGATAPDLHDNYFVPTSEGVAMPGVEIHANILQNLILDNFLKKEGLFLMLLLTFIIGFIGLFFISKLKIYYFIPLVVLIIIAYSFIAIFIFDQFNFVMDMFFFPLALLIFTGTGVGVNYLSEKKHSQYLADAFGKYISKDLLKEIVTHKKELKLGGGKRTITIFFSDIRNFTSISEKLKPEELVKLLNEYLTEMGKIILDYKGTVDKFIGDAIMAFWNAPLTLDNHAEMACRATIEQVRKIKELQEKWKKEGMPLVEIGCGLHTGSAIIGNMGSEDRFDYTAIGDTINLGSRLEGLTKQYGVSIIVSEDVYNAVKDKFNFRKLDTVRVKGKNIPVRIYELVVDENKEFNEKYERALQLYSKSEFKEAVKEFESALKLKKDDKSCILFIERCRDYAKNPPGKDWDGVFELKTK